jgi:2-keto-3-deoxy-L-rhamnonate aldolase RhmA
MKVPVLDEKNLDQRLEADVLSLAATRGLDKTFCPSDVARSIGGPHPDNWGPLMQPIRRVAVRLAKEGRLVITRKGKPVDPDDFRGVYRLGLPRED